ncbi:hypothetical protein QBC47DRAFT_440165 [Echria macrotheca]|uniref:Uncharacterized protein n=1 Tax=Echria macrotheca TaxID=438768 RepID=A0AAJ0F5Z6_9PEZI|nr:hypothetical protein QBC47DRAFT_440165 [Echria macrotheca]
MCFNNSADLVCSHAVTWYRARPGKKVAFCARTKANVLYLLHKYQILPTDLSDSAWFDSQLLPDLLARCNLAHGEGFAAVVNPHFRQLVIYFLTRWAPRADGLLSVDASTGQHVWDPDTTSRHFGSPSTVQAWMDSLKMKEGTSRSDDSQATITEEMIVVRLDVEDRPSPMTGTVPASVPALAPGRVPIFLPELRVRDRHMRHGRRHHQERPADAPTAAAVQPLASPVVEDVDTASTVYFARDGNSGSVSVAGTATAFTSTQMTEYWSDNHDSGSVSVAGSITDEQEQLPAQKQETANASPPVSPRQKRFLESLETSAAARFIMIEAEIAARKAVFAVDDEHDENWV